MLLVRIQYSFETDKVQEEDMFYQTDYLRVDGVKIDHYQVLGNTITFFPLKEEGKMKLDPIPWPLMSNGFVAKEVIVTNIESYARYEESIFTLFSKPKCN